MAGTPPALKRPAFVWHRDWTPFTWKNILGTGFVISPSRQTNRPETCQFNEDVSVPRESLVMRRRRDDGHSRRNWSTNLAHKERSAEPLQSALCDRLFDTTFATCRRQPTQTSEGQSSSLFCQIYIVAGRREFQRPSWSNVKPQTPLAHPLLLLGESRRSAEALSPSSATCWLPGVGVVVRAGWWPLAESAPEPRLHAACWIYTTCGIASWGKPISWGAEGVSTFVRENKSLKIFLTRK